MASIASAFPRETIEARALPPVPGTHLSTPGSREESLPGSVASSPTMQDRDGDMSGDGLSVSVKHQAAFVSKLYSMVEDATIPTLQWSESGTTFIVTSPIEFSKCLHNFFKHNNWQSFVRQLNMYQFHKVNDVFHSNANNGPSENSAWEFKHACFRRGRVDLLTGIKRKASKPTHSSAHRDGGFSTSGIKENSPFFGHSASHGINGSSHHSSAPSRADTLLDLASQRITAGEETQRMLMDQNAAMFNVLRSYQSILTGMANVLATVSPTTSTQAIQNDLFTLDHHLRHLQFPNRHGAHAVAPTPYPSAPTPPPTWSQTARSPSIPPLASPSSYFSPRIGTSPEADYFRSQQHNSRPLAPTHPATGPMVTHTLPPRPTPPPSHSSPELRSGGLPYPSSSAKHSSAPKSPVHEQVAAAGIEPVHKRARPAWPSTMPTPPLSDTSASTLSSASTPITSSVREQPPARPASSTDLAGNRPNIGPRGGSLHSLLNEEDSKINTSMDLKRRRSNDLTHS